MITSPTSQENQSDKLLLQRFQLYENNQVQLCHILRFWDRAQGLLLRPFNSEEGGPDADEQPGPERHAASGKKTKKEREKERLEKDKQKVDGEVKSASPEPGRVPMTGEAAEQLDGAPDTVPHIVVPVSKREHSVATEMLQNGRLPSTDEVQAQQDYMPCLLTAQRHCLFLYHVVTQKLY